MNRKIIFIILVIMAIGAFLVYILTRAPAPRFTPSEGIQEAPQFSMSGKIKNIQGQTLILETEDLSVKIKKPFEKRPLAEKKILTTDKTIFKKINEKNEAIKSSFQDLKPESIVFALSDEDITFKKEFAAKEIILIQKTKQGP